MINILDFQKFYTIYHKKLKDNLKMTESKTESIVPHNLDEAIKFLIKSSLSAHDIAFGQKQKLWCTWLNKFFSVYVKINDSSKFKNMFNSFFELHREFLIKPIFSDEDGQMIVNDSLFKINDIITTPGVDPIKIKSTKNESWSPQDTFCKGHVIYYDAEKTKAVSIAINEIYQTATKLYKEQGSNDTNIQSLPGKILLGLYCIFLYSLPVDDSDIEQIKSNVKLLGDYINDIVSDTSKSSNSALSGITKIMADVMKSTGLSNNINPSELENALSGALSGDAMKSVSNVVGELMNNVNANTKENSSIGDVMSTIGTALQSDNLKNMMKTTADQTSDLIKSIPSLNSFVEGLNTNGNVSATASVTVNVTSNPVLAAEQD